MRNPALGLALMLACVAALWGCGKNAPAMTQERIPLTPKLVREIGLPVYPGSKPMERSPALRQRIATPYGTSDALVLAYETPDDFDRVLAFYGGQLPATSRKFAFHNFGIGSAAFEFWVKDGLREVTVTSMQGKTLIMLQASRLMVATPAPTSGASQAASQETPASQH